MRLKLSFYIRYIDEIFLSFSGIHVDVIRFNAEVSEDSLVKKISELNHDENSDAILLQVKTIQFFCLPVMFSTDWPLNICDPVQLPLPSHINGSITNLISADKDVDGFTSTNFGKFCLGFNSFVPCTALAVRAILEHIRTYPISSLKFSSSLEPNLILYDARWKYSW